MNTFSPIYLLGALCFFLYGLHLAGESLRQAAGDRLRGRVGKIARNRLLALVLGIVMTVVFQSSTATTSMLVGLAGIGLLSVRDALPVVLGADVGTTLLVLLLAFVVQFDASGFALSILVVGFVFSFVLRHTKNRHYAEAVVGLGFVFYGLTLINQSSLPLRESGLFRDVLGAVASYPGVAVFVGALMAGLLHSSAAVLGILLSFAASGLFTVVEAVPFVLGANIGSTVGPLLASIKSPAEGKRLAYMHVMIKIVGVILFLPFVEMLGQGVATVVDGPSFQVATVHIVFNVTIAILFLPFVATLSKLATNLAQDESNGKEFSPKYLEDHALDAPTMAFANVFREILRMGDIAQEMCSQAMVPFEEAGNETMERLEELDDQIDVLDREIKFYLARLSQPKLTDEQGKRSLELLMLTHDLESIGDIVSKEMIQLARKKQRKQVSFSTEGWEEIKDFHEKVMENFQLAMTSFATGDVSLGKKVIRHKKHLAQIEQDLGQAHLMRLHEGHKESIETSSIHLDILSSLRRVNSVVSKMAYPVLDRREE